MDAEFRTITVSNAVYLFIYIFGIIGLVIWLDRCKRVLLYTAVIHPTESHWWFFIVRKKRKQWPRRSTDSPLKTDFLFVKKNQNRLASSNLAATFKTNQIYSHFSLPPTVLLTRYLIRGFTFPDCIFFSYCLRRTQSTHTLWRFAQDTRPQQMDTWNKKSTFAGWKHKHHFAQISISCPQWESHYTLC